MTAIKFNASSADVSAVPTNAPFLVSINKAGDVTFHRRVDGEAQDAVLSIDEARTYLKRALSVERTLYYQPKPSKPGLEDGMSIQDKSPKWAYGQSMADHRTGMYRDSGGRAGFLVTLPAKGKKTETYFVALDTAHSILFGSWRRVDFASPFNGSKRSIKVSDLVRTVEAVEAAGVQVVTYAHYNALRNVKPEPRIVWTAPAGKDEQGRSRPEFRLSMSEEDREALRAGIIEPRSRKAGVEGTQAIRVAGDGVERLFTLSIRTPLAGEIQGLTATRALNRASLFTIAFMDRDGNPSDTQYEIIGAVTIEQLAMELFGLELAALPEQLVRTGDRPFISSTAFRAQRRATLEQSEEEVIEDRAGVVDVEDLIY